ncbi:MAG: hypothetical protein GIKADHBN_01533 [Phycisphaerales bacterium]|nr:hypothetical protein [Phycisphaerales bacterium]
MPVKSGQRARWIVAIGVAAVCSLPLVTQPPVARAGSIHAAQPAAPVPAPEVVWRNVIAAYRNGPIAERVRVGIITPRPRKPTDPTDTADADRLALESFLREGGPDADERRGVIFFRSAPTPTGDRLIRLEMGDLRVFAETGMIAAIRQSVPGGIVVRVFDGPVTTRQFAELMPPLMLPQLAMSLARPDEPFDLLPGLPAIEWELAQRIRDGSQTRLQLRGTTASARGEHRVEIAVDEASFRFVRVKVTAPPDQPIDPKTGEPVDGDVVLELFITPIDPGDPAQWRLATDGRIAVGAIEELRSAPPAPAIAGPATLKPGDRLPQLHLCNARTEAWASDKSSAAMLAGIVPEDATSFRAALLFFSPPADAPARQRLAKARAILESAARDATAGRKQETPSDAPAEPGHSPPPIVKAGGVALLEYDGFDAARLAVLREWTARAAPDAADTTLVCSPAGPGVLARFVDPPAPVIVIIDESLVIRSVIPVQSDTVADECIRVLAAELAR